MRTRPHGIEQVLQMIGAMSGPPIATGLANVLEALKRKGEEKGHPLSQSYLDRLKGQIEAHGATESVMLIEDASGQLAVTFQKSPGARGDGVSDMSGFDLWKALDRRAAKPKRPETPFEEFMRIANDHVAGDTQTGDDHRESLTANLLVAVGGVAVSLTRYMRADHTDDDAKIVAGALAAMIEKSGIADPAQFGNLGKYLEPYGFNLSALVHLLKEFAKNPRVKVAEGLLNELSRLTPALICVSYDAEKKAQKAYEDALNI